MGEVYKARDPRLGRDVAVKVLPPGLAADPERRRRFSRCTTWALTTAHRSWSLGAPRAEPYSFALNRRFVDEIVRMSDDQIRHAMALLFRSAKLVTEPGGAAALAALVGPLRKRLAGKRVVVIVCGGNVDAATFARELAAAPPVA